MIAIFQRRRLSGCGCVAESSITCKMSSASAISSVRHGVLLRQALVRRNAGNRDPECRALSGLGVENKSAAELLRHEVVDDVKSEPCAARMPAGGEKRIESL